MNRKLLAISAAAIAATLMFISSLHAETVNTNADLPNSKKTATYLHSRPMFEALYRLGVEQDRKFGLQLDCKSQYNVQPYSVSALSPIDFPDDKQNPTKGIWNFRYQLQRCGDSKFYNTLFFANSNGEAPTPRAYYPGSTNASPVLVKDAMLSAIMGAVVRSGLKDCKDFDVFDMRVTEPAHDVVEGDKTIKGVWNEIWTLKVCNQAIDVAMTFIPDANGGGTSFTTGPAKVGDTTAKP